MIARHPCGTGATAGAVASFRTWRGSRPALAQDPAIIGERVFPLLLRRIHTRVRQFGSAPASYDTILFPIHADAVRLQPVIRLAHEPSCKPHPDSQRMA